MADLDYITKRMNTNRREVLRNFGSSKLENQPRRLKKSGPQRRTDAS